MYLKYERNCRFFCFSLWPLQVLITVDLMWHTLFKTRAASTPFLSTSLALYIIIMLTSTINFSADIPSTSSKISITTPKWVILPSGDHPFFFFGPWTYGNLSSILWQLYFSKDRNSSLCIKWTKVAALIWLFSYKTKLLPISVCAEMGNLRVYGNEWLSQFA